MTKSNLVNQRGHTPGIVEFWHLCDRESIRCARAGPAIRRVLRSGKHVRFYELTSESRRKMHIREFIYGAVVKKPGATPVKHVFSDEPVSKTHTEKTRF